MSRSTLVSAISLYALCAGFGAVHAKGTSRAHVVQAGQTLWEIARTYDCDVSELQAANDIDGMLIQPGQTLAIPHCSGESGAPVASVRASTSTDASTRSEEGLFLLTYEVSSGDTLYEIAEHYDTSVDDILQRNQLTGTVIRPGQTLRVAVGKDGQGRPIPGQSLGAASDGKLAGAMQLPDGPGYYRRRPQSAWGTNHAIHHIRRAVSVVRNHFPKVHDLAIGDISARAGGPLGEHKSHQSGRDVDMGLYFHKRPSGYPESFIRATSDTLDIAATWTLIEALAATARSDAGVEVMFLDYELQQLLYGWAEKQGVSKHRLGEIFQYPRGEASASGLIRHEPGHDTHVHVRFKCPKNDDGCW